MRKVTLALLATAVVTIITLSPPKGDFENATGGKQEFESTSKGDVE